MFDLTPATAAVLLIDMQERFLPAIPDIAPDRPCGANARILLAGAQLLGVPITISEQYVKGLGPTLPHLVEAAPEARRYDKTHFSCGDDPTLAAHLAHLAARSAETIVVAGIEAHVCVLATVADLRRAGHQVIVAADAVASRRPEHRDLALAAMRDLGALALPVESILFRMQRQAGVGCFKQISALVR